MKVIDGLMDCHYFSLVNTCQSSPCKNGATCTQTETPQRYKCTCRLGYKGVNCDTGIVVEVLYCLAHFLESGVLQIQRKKKKYRLPDGLQITKVRVLGTRKWPV